MLQNTSWHQGCSIYEVYIRSFKDSDNDGIGDLQGIVDKLDYIADLGVDAVWVSPFYPSPMKDFGYDVSDYCAVDPMFGSIDGFKNLTTKAHDLGLKVIIDQVWSHTSDKHPWFIASANPDHPDHALYKDWFVWADPKENNAMPNNWLSVFGGAAWEWHTARQQYFLHNFLKEQPDLNWHNPAVRQAITDTANFWLDNGVDGFRLDVCNFYTHNPDLTDNPNSPPGTPRLLGIDPATPFAQQLHIHNINQQKNLGYIQEIKRASVDRFNNTPNSRAMLGEIVAINNPIHTMQYYVEPETGLATAYSGALVHDGILQAPEIADLLIKCEEHMPQKMVCWLTGTHDFPRLASRCGIQNNELRQDYLKLALILMVSMRGNVCLYQGEELGLEEAEIAFEDMQDPYGIALYPKSKTRDGCRTPMPWHQEEKNAGFSNADKPWLPLWPSHTAQSVAQQTNDKSSLLNFFKDILHFRKNSAIMKLGTVENISLHGNVLSFTRHFEDQNLYCLFNLSDEHYELPDDYKKLSLFMSNKDFHDKKIPAYFSGIFK